MKRLIYFIILAVYAASALSNSFSGYWAGSVMNIPIVYHIYDTSGTTKSTLSSPSQGAFHLPCDETIINGDSIIIRISSLNAEYKGKMSSDRNSITGTFSQGISTEMTLTPATAESITPPRPQEPQPPFIYNSREVTFSHDGITLSGTLTTPSVSFGRRFQAVVLVSGSGAQNRDEEIYGHKPFAVIADHLTRAGIAVLRYDDRGIGGSSSGKPDDTTLDFVNDAIAAVNFLKQQKEIDSEQIGILGHSEGGTIALISAATHPDEIAFAISMAGVAVKGRDAMIEQNRMIATATGVPLTADIDQSVTRIFNAIDTIHDSAELSDTLRNIMTNTRQHSPRQIEQTVTVMTSPWYTAFIRLDTSEYLSCIKCPILAINGEWDLQVNSAQNLKAIKQALPHAITKEYPRLNHLFQESSSLAGSLNYGTIMQTISPQVLSDITDFIIKLSHKKHLTPR